MKTLQISTPFLPVSGDLKYGGTERVVNLLDKELVRLGHDSYVAAPRTSKPNGILLPTVEYDTGIADVLDKREVVECEGLNLRLEHIARSILFANEVGFEIAHIHDDNMVPFAPLIKIPKLLTLHSYYEGEFWNPQFHPNITNVGLNLVSISENQKEFYEKNGFKVNHVVYNGVDNDFFEFCPTKEKFVLSLGTIQPRKGQLEAIESSAIAGVDLILAGNPGHKDYFESFIKPRITHDLSDSKRKLEDYLSINDGIAGRRVVYVGEVNDLEKRPLYQKASAFLMPITRPEPFGLVMVEAMMSGTPVIAYKCGSTPEIVSHGKSGYIVEDVKEMGEAIHRIKNLNPEDCREYSVNKFSKEKMVENYINVYKEIIESSK